jgi:hypothetical protein
MVDLGSLESTHLTRDLIHVSNWLPSRASKQWEKSSGPNPKKSNVEWWNKKNFNDKKIEIKRIRTSFKERNKKDNLKFWIEGQNWKRKGERSNQQMNPKWKKNQENENQIQKKKIMELRMRLKKKYWGSNLIYHQILNWREKLKRKIKFTKESKTKIKFKRMRTKYEKK